MDRLQEGFLAAVSDDEAFDALPAGIARLCGGRSAIIFAVDRVGSVRINAWNHWTAEQMQVYAEQFAQFDPWLTAAVDRDLTGRAYAMCEVVPDEQFTNSAVWADFYRSIGDDTGRSVGALMLGGGGERIAVAVHRGLGDARFGRGEEAALDGVLDQLRLLLRARALLGEAAGRRMEMETAVALAGAAVALVSKDRRPRHLSPAFARILQGADGLRLRGGKIHLDDPVAQDLFASGAWRIGEGGTPQRATFVSRRPSGRREYVVRLTPAGSSENALISINDPDADCATKVDAIAAAYRLSAAEADLLRLLAGGATLDAAAAMRSTSVRTARTQLSNMFAKTRTSRQSDLIALVLRVSA